MKNLTLIVCAFLGALVMAGCSSQAPATKQEENSFRNPPKEMPKEAMEAMGKMGKGAPAGSQPPATTGG